MSRGEGVLFCAGEGGAEEKVALGAALSGGVLQARAFSISMVTVPSARTKAGMPTPPLARTAS